jgi:hypothetical protein
MRILDEYGRERDWAWLEQTFGPVVIHPAAPGLGWRLVEMRADRDLVLAENESVTATIGPLAAPTIMAKALAADGRPVAELWLAWYWPDAPENAGSMPPNGLPAGMRPGRADRPGVTNFNGDVGFAMGPGAYYFPPAIGPHAVWCWGMNSDVVFGLGMLGATNHDHLNLVFQQCLVDPVVPPPEPVPGLEEVLARVAVIERQCEEIRALLG